MVFKDYNYKNYFRIAEAMRIYNSTAPEQKFTIIDFNILCMVRSFYINGQDFYMTNDQLARSLLSCKKTIKNSINRLCTQGLLKKELIGTNRKEGRYLIYQHEEVENFIARMQFQG